MKISEKFWNINLIGNFTNPQQYLFSFQHFARNGCHLIKQNMGMERCIPFKNSLVMPILPCVYIHLLYSDWERRLWPFEIFLIRFHVFVYAFPPEISSIFSKFFPFPLPYFVLSILQYFSFHIITWLKLYTREQGLLRLRKGQQCIQCHSFHWRMAQILILYPEEYLDTFDLIVNLIKGELNELNKQMSQ